MIHMERRKFLAGVSAAVAGTTQLPSILSFESVEATVHPTRRAEFERQLGTEFRVYDNDGRFADKVRLVAIEGGPCCSGLEQFSLVFAGTQGPALSEGIWRLTNGTDQAKDLALTSARASSQPRYRAMFNLLA